VVSEAEAVTLIVPETVAPAVGEVMATVGGVISGVTVKVAVLLGKLPVEFLTTTTNFASLSAEVVAGVV